MKKRLSLMMVISLVIVMGLSLISGFSFAATDDSANVEYVALNSKDSSAISGLEVNVFKIGSMDSNKMIILDDDFKDMTIDLNDYSEANLAKLQEYCEENSTPVMTLTTGEDGTFDIRDVEYGLYLFVQGNMKDDFKVQNMLVDVPTFTENGYDYDVTVKAKIIDKRTSDNNDQHNPPAVKDRELANTGSLEWVVPVLVVAGIAVFCIGWITFYTGKKKVN